MLETNMETKELKIQIPEGYEIDKENSSFEKIVFKKKEDTKPRSWEEYCYLQKSKHAKGYFTDRNAYITEANWTTMNNPLMWRSMFPSKELCDASRAMAQLMSIRNSWIGDWKYEWDGKDVKYCLIYCNNNIGVTFNSSTSRPLAFPTEKMATDFINTFKDLLKIAKPLL